MEVRLVLKQAKKGSKVFRVKGSDALIGRAHGSAVRIPSSDVSREHCRLVVEETTVTVQDLGSTNGTLLNGVVVEGVQEVQPGDFLRVGPAIFKVEFDPGAAEESPFEIVDETEENVVSGDEYVLAVSDEPEAEPLPQTQPGELELMPEPNPEMSQGWQVPEAGDLRDLLSQLDEPSAPKAPKKRKKKK